MNLNSKIVIFGDFNLSDISWCRSPSGPASIVNCADLCPHSSLFTEVLDTHALQQFNILPSQPQVTTNVLDLVMSNGASTTVTYTEKATSTTHSALHVVVDVLAEHHTAQINREVYNFKRADWREINTLLNYVDWSCLHDFTTVDEAVTYFYDIVFATMKDCIPVQRISYKRYPYWFDPQLISLIKSKTKFHREYIKTNRDKTSNAYLKFCDLRKEVKALQKSKYLEYIENIGEEIKVNSKRFWTFVKYLKGISSLPQIMTYGQREMKTYTEIADGFNTFFKSVFKVNADGIPHCNFRDVPLFRFKKVLADEMLKELISIKQNTSTGSDKFPATFIIKCAPRLCYPLKIIFNLSIEKGEYPSIFKRNNVISIYKQKDAKLKLSPTGVFLFNLYL